MWGKTTAAPAHGEPAMIVALLTAAVILGLAAVPLVFLLLIVAAVWIAFRHPRSRASIAACYPEPNGLLPLSSHDEKSKTPSAKSIPVVVRPIA